MNDERACSVCGDLTHSNFLAWFLSQFSFLNLKCDVMGERREPTIGV